MDTFPATGLLWFLAFLFSTTVHEAMHALLAWKGGDPTAYHGGQVSLSPLPHIKREPIGMVIVPLLTSLTQGWAMGWASAPYDPEWALRYPRRAAVMAAAGPAGNLAIATIAFAAIKAGLALGWFTSPDSASFDLLVDAAVPAAGFAATALSILVVMNVFLALFNLLPLPPLDGFSVLGLVLPERYAASVQAFHANGATSMVGLVIAWRVFPLFTNPVFSLLLKLVHPAESYS
jgi:Zn-dependent protease